MKFSKKTLVLITCLTLGCLLPYCAQGIDQQTAQIGKAATVILTAEIGDAGKGNGSGFFIREDLIVTNIHVVAGIYGKTITCSAESANQSAEYTIKGVVASDPEHDLVILKVEGEGASILQLGDSDAVKLGEKIIAIGTYRDTPGTAIKGTITRTTPHFFRVAGTLPSGYSGSPVLNHTGKVIGICVEGGESKNFGFIIPSNRLKALLKEIATQEKPLEEWREEPFISAYALVKQGDKRMVLGDAENAITAYDTAIRLKPDFAAAYTRRAGAKSASGDYEGMVRDLDAAIHLGQDHVHNYINRGVAKRNLRHYSAAITDYDTAVHLDPKYAATYLNRGNAKLDLGNHKMAIEDYDTAIHLKPKDAILAVAYFKRADAKSRAGDTKGAVDDFNQAIRLKPDNAPILAAAYLNRGLAKFDLGDTAGAIKDYDEIIRLKPRKAMLTSAYIYRANTKSKLGDNIGAIKDYDVALRLFEDNNDLAAYTYSRRAAAKLNVNDNKGAIEDSDTAVRFNPDLPEAYRIRGDAKSNLGNYNAAIEDYDTAIHLKPAYAKAYYKRGSAKVEIGNIPGAKIDFQTALKLVEWEGSQLLKTEIESGLRLVE